MSDTFAFEIYFFGLICIHGASAERRTERGEKINAMMLEDADHTPLLYLNSKNVRFELKSKSNVKFENLPKGKASVLHSFDEFVPHLEDLTRSPTKLRPDAYGVKIKLPSGQLVTVHNYYTLGEYELDGAKVERPTDCVARLTMLHVTTLRPEVGVVFTPVSGIQQDEPVSSAGFVLLANSELKNIDNPPATGRTLRPGFKKHAKATDHNAQYIADLYELDDQKCSTSINNPSHIKAVHLATVLDIVGSFPVFAHPECSNTNWP